MVLSAFGDVESRPLENYGNWREKTASLAMAPRTASPSILAEAPFQLKPKAAFLTFILIKRH